MRTTPTKTLHKWLVWTMASVLVISVLVWYVTRERLPATIRIATAEPGGQYFRFGKALETAQVARTGRPVEVCLTKGSVENRQRLLSNEAQQRVDVAVIQNGAVPMDGLTVVAPLHYDVVHVVVRRNREIHSILDLADKTVVLGPAGSGMRRSAENVLDHYDLTERVVDRRSAYFHDMLEDPSLDAAIVTTGVANTDLKEVLHNEDFELLPLDAEALAMKYAYFECFDIPRGLYAEGPPAPACICFGTVGGD